MDRQCIYLSPELIKQFGAPVNIVASIICLLSKDGKQRVTATEQFLADRTFLSARLVSKAKKLLKEHGYINIATSSAGFKHYSVITATEKLIQAFFIPEESSEETAMECLDNTEQCAVSTSHSMRNRYSTECLDHTHSVRTDIAQCACSDIAQCANKNNKTIYENNREINKRARENFDDCAQMSENDVQDFLTIPLADDYDFEDQNDLKNDITEQVNLIPLKSNAPQAEEKKSSAKRKESKKENKKERVAVEYPKDAAEVLKLMQEWSAKHVSVEPRIQGVNIALESEKFFDYWTSHNWTNKRGKIKSINSTIATWLGFAIDKVKGNYTAPVTATTPAQTPDQDRPKISIFEAVARGLCKDLDEASALANADGWIYEDQIKNNTIDAEFEIVEDEPLALER